MISNITVTMKRPTLPWHHPTSPGFVANAPIRMRAASQGPATFVRHPTQSARCWWYPCPLLLRRCQTLWHCWLWHPRCPQSLRAFISQRVSAPDVVQVVASTSPAKPVCIGQPVCSSGSIIEPSAPDAVQAVASVSLAKAVRICQPAPSSSGSVIDLSAPDAALAVASASLTKPVFIHQPATRSSGSVIDLSTPDAALAAASALPAKPMFGLSSGIVIDIAGIDAVDENHVLTDQNLALAIDVGQLRSQEQEPAYRCRALEVLLDRKWSDNRSQRDVIHNLQTRLANNNANLISELQEY